MFTRFEICAGVLQLASLGAAAVISYGVVSNVTYGTCLTFAWITFLKQVVRRALRVYEIIYSNVNQLGRFTP